MTLMFDVLPDPAELTDQELALWLRAAAAQEERRRYVWDRYARDDQLRPPGPWRVWLLLGGRGAGKTRTGAETMRAWAEEDPGQHLAVVAKTHREVLNICFEAPRAGLIRVVPPWEVMKFLRGSGSVELQLQNGSTLRAFSAQDPEAMRGYAFDRVWLDEYAAYPPKLAQVSYDMAWFCMRESPDPRMVVTTTPKPLPHVKALVERAERRPDQVVLTRSKTWDNRRNLSGPALEVLEEQYAGTRLGRQELEAELLEDVEGSLWKLGWIEAGRVDEAEVFGDAELSIEPTIKLTRRYVAVDPADTVSETSDETGIIVAGIAADGDVYVLADRSMKVAGLAAAKRAWQAFVEFGCSKLIIEGSSLWMKDLLTLAWNEAVEEGLVPAGLMPLQIAQPFASKQMRAAPIAALYEKDPPRVHHVGKGFGKLEEQLTTWTPEDGTDSPDRMDALVYVVGDLRASIARRATVSRPTVGGVPTQPVGQVPNGGGGRPVGPGRGR